MTEDELKQVENLLKRVVDSRDGYADAHEQCDSVHTEYVGELAGTRQDYAKMIKEKLEANGRDVDLEGSFLGDIHRFFMDIKNKMDAGDDEELFEEIIRGETRLLADYDETLQKLTSDDVFKGKLQQQRNAVASNLDLVKAKEEAA